KVRGARIPPPPPIPLSVIRFGVWGPDPVRTPPPFRLDLDSAGGRWTRTLGGQRFATVRHQRAYQGPMDCQSGAGALLLDDRIPAKSSRNIRRCRVRQSPPIMRMLTIFLAAAALLVGGAASRVMGICGPFTDVVPDAFCPYVLEIFTLGITTGLTPTTYDPSSSVTRLQMAAFLSRTVDGVLRRGRKRAALGQFWPLQTSTFFDVTTVGNTPHLPASDGTDVWVPNLIAFTVSRVRAG